MSDIISEEWECAVKHLLEASIPGRCPEYVAVPRKVPQLPRQPGSRRI